MIKNKRTAFIVTVALISILSVAVICLLLYEILVEKKIEVSSIIRAAILIAVSIVAVIRLKTSVPSAKLYRDAYGDIIGNAFVGKKEEKLFMRAISEYNNNRFMKAIKILEELSNSELTLDEAFAVTAFIGISYDDMGFDEKAIITYNKALTLRANSTLASNCGLCYQRIGHNGDAISAYRHAIEIDPQNAFAYNNVAQLYLKECKYEDALLYAEKAAELKNNMYQAFSAQTIAHAMLGNNAAYEETLRRAVMNGADRQAIESTIKTLKLEADEGKNKVNN